MTILDEAKDTHGNCALANEIIIVHEDGAAVLAEGDKTDFIIGEHHIETIGEKETLKAGTSGINDPGTSPNTKIIDINKVAPI